MTKEEIVALIKENAASKDDVASAVKAALSEFKPVGFITEADADKKVQAALSAHKPTLTEAELAELAAQAEAKVTAKLGAGPLQLNISAHKNDNAYQAMLTKYRESAPSEAVAVARLLRDHPELNEARNNALVTERAKLNAA